MAQLVENIVLCEGMIAIRFVLNGQLEWGLRPEDQVKVAVRIADAMHNVSGSSTIARHAAARSINELLQDEPNLSRLLMQSQGWAEEVARSEE